MKKLVTLFVILLLIQLILAVNIKKLLKPSAKKTTVEKPKILNGIVAKVNEIAQLFAEYPPPPPCKYELGPSFCPAFGRPFTGIDGSTNCTACTISCNNIVLFKNSSGHTTCSVPYYNYGCHARFHCVDEKAKFQGQYKAAIGFCMLYNGCKVSKSDDEIDSFVRTKTASKAKEFTETVLNKIQNVEFEDLRAFLLQLMNGQLLIRFKLVQDIIDAQYKNQTLDAFLDRHPLTRIPLPRAISALSTDNWLVQAIYLWKMVKTLPFEKLPETKIAEQIKVLALTLQQSKKEVVNKQVELEQKMRKDLKQGKGFFNGIKGKFNVIGNQAGIYQQNKDVNNKASLDSLAISCHYIKRIKEAEADFSALVNKEEFEKAKNKTVSIEKWVNLGKRAYGGVSSSFEALLQDPSWDILQAANIEFHKSVLGRTEAERSVNKVLTTTCKVHDYVKASVSRFFKKKK